MMLGMLLGIAVGEAVRIIARSLWSFWRGAVPLYERPRQTIRKVNYW